MATLVGSTLCDQYYIRELVGFRRDGGFIFSMGYITPQLFARNEVSKHAMETALLVP